MTGGTTDSSIFAAAQLREWLEDGLDGKESRAHPHAGLLEDDDSQRLLNRLATLYDAESHAALPDEFEDTRLFREAVANQSTVMLAEAVRSGNVSQMQHAVGLVNQDTDAGDGNAIARLGRTLAREGTIVVITGPPGSGKTALMIDAVTAAATFANAGIVGNVPEWSRQDEMVQSSPELLDAMGDRDGQVIGALDEVARFISSKGGTNQQADRFANDLRWIRKKEDGDRYAKQGSVALIAHTEKGAGREIRRLADQIWHKPSREDPGRLEIKDLSADGNQSETTATYKGVTDTREDYDEHGISLFHVPVEDDDKEDDQDGNPKREAAVETVIRAVEKSGMGYEDAAELVDYSDSWVGNRVREWRRGEKWNDLVDDLEPPEDEDE
ncbi:hypothetical protein BRD00_01605 [Halobacteriales archaeon QS_8_69_26]|nr:MAG: hypothetical protein BRD00_01605 [Halobacteriales archaeon QS_8_69_26]